ncbi:MAG: glycoside hydrolase family 3 C-terminal domain-containing protein [Halioglobus sp.]
MKIPSSPVKAIALGILISVTPLVDAQILEKKIDKLLSEMTLVEKAGLTSGASMWRTKSIERLGIPSIMMTDGPHGVRKSIDGQFGDPEPATCYPPAVTLASTWNSELAYDVGAALGRESQAMGVQILLGPGTNIKRSPLGGRNFEYFSEDPILSGKFSTAYIQGVQSQGVGVSLKHYAVNDQEHERMTISAEVSLRALHEIYLRPFEMAVREAQPTTLMNAYNKINGTYASNNEYLLNEVLRKQWGFDGMVVTDWGAADDRVQGIRARLHLQMPADGGVNDQKIVAAIKNGELAESELDEVLHTTLAVTLSLDESKGKYDSYDREQHHQLAYQVASEGIVLLKNENNILPLGKNAEIAVIGNFAKTPRYQGSGSSLVIPTRMDNLIDNLNATFAPGYDLLGKTSPRLLEEATQIARSADKVVVVIGLTFLEESEGFDRANYDIAPGHLQLLEAVIDANPNVVVVLQNGSPVAMPWIDQVDGVVEAYLGGQAGGRALADVLTGKVNPSGKLAETFPIKIEDNPTFIAWAGEEGKSYYNEGVFVGYRYYDKKKVEPLFPFGYGLSYSNFEFSDISVDRSAISENDTVNISLSVKNTGKVSGKEVVQLYVRDMESSVGRPQKELKHFAKISLKPGEAEVVSFQLSNRDFAFYSARHQQWITESGDFTVMIGNSSRNLPLRQKISLTVLNPPKEVYTKYSLIKELKGHPVGETIMAQIMSIFGGSPQSDEAQESLSEADKVNIMKKTILMENLLADMPIKNVIPFSNGAVSEADLEKMLGVLNQ